MPRDNARIQVESALAYKIPSALTPIEKMVRPVISSGIGPLDELLRGVREFPAQSLLRLRPELHGAACVVMSDEAPSEDICSLNTKARLSGIRHGMSRVEIGTFANPVVMRRSIASESMTKAALLEVAGSFSPRVEDRSEETGFLCGIDITGMRSLFGPPEQLGRNLLTQIRASGMSASVAVSTNFHAAASLARGFSRRSSVQVVASGDEAISLSSLPLTVLAVSEMQLETFATWGIYRLGELAALPEKELISRMGQDGKRQRLKGSFEICLKEHHP